MSDNEKLREITASEVAVEVTDARTGVTVRRTLPIDFHETANCLRLAAEDAEGRPRSWCSTPTPASDACGTSPAEGRTRTPAEAMEAAI